MTTATMLETVRALGASCSFACTGDVIQAMGGRCLHQDNVNKSISRASSAVPSTIGISVTCVDVFGELLICEVRIHPSPVIIALGP